MICMFIIGGPIKKPCESESESERERERERERQRGRDRHKVLSAYIGVFDASSTYLFAPGRAYTGRGSSAGVAQEKRADRCARG